MTGSQGGDQRAYLTLLKAITPYLRALARRAGFGADEIEDGVQDVLLTIHAVRHTYDPKRPFTPWLVAVARHRLADRARRRNRISARETQLIEAHETLAAEETNLHERASDVRRLRIAISALPRRSLASQRVAVTMPVIGPMIPKARRTLTELTLKRQPDIVFRQSRSGGDRALQIQKLAFLHSALERILPVEPMQH